jgi:hypothetical protein
MKLPRMCILAMALALPSTSFADPLISGASDSLVRGLASWSAATPLAPPNGTADFAYFDSILPPSASSIAPAVQQGSDNSATIALSGANGIAVLMQLGNNNSATLNLSATGATGMVLQGGDFNSGTVEISANNSWGVLEQLGNGNDGGLDIQSSNTRVLYQQGGGVIDAGPVVVNSSAGSGGGMITIARQ